MIYGLQQAQVAGPQKIGGEEDPPPKTNMVHLKMGGPLEKEIPFGHHHFSFRGV